MAGRSRSGRARQKILTTWEQNPLRAQEREPECFGPDARYERLRCIGLGANGVVYEVFDRLRKRRIALKTLVESTPASLLGFKREFRALAELRHPNLVHLYELVSPAEGSAFITMELVEGSDFRHYARKVAASPGLTLRPTPTLTEPALIGARRAPRSLDERVLESTPAHLDELRAALLQLVAGLRALHAAGKLHRDIKPSNVMVSTEGRVVILDFGLSTGVAYREASGNSIAGTPEYMAPEQVLNEALQPSSDWYAVGALLFDALVGRPPYRGAVMDILHQKLSLSCPRPSELVSGVPADLDLLCAQLLEREPALRPTGREIAKRLSSGASSVSLRPSFLPTSLVGRESEIEALERAFSEVCNQGAAALLVHGPSGIGKSSLLSHFAERLGGEQRATVLYSRVYEQEAIPYKAVDGIMDLLSQELEAAERDGRPLPPDPSLRALGQLFPVLRRLPAFGGLGVDEPADPLRTRERAFTGLSLVLAHLTRGRAMVWIIDDVQWGDSDSVELLVETLAQARSIPLLLVLSHRERAREPSAFLDLLLASWAPTVRLIELIIGALSEADVRRLLVESLSASSEMADTVVGKVFQLSTGNPFLAHELAHTLRPTSAAATAELALPPREQDSLATALLDERLGGLDDSALRLLETVAASGRPLSSDAAADAAGIGSRIDGAVGELSQRRLLRSVHHGGLELLEVSHDRIRSWILLRLPEAELRRRHYRIAQVLEATPDADADLWIEHWLRSGDGAEIRRVALPAAARAAERLALKRAEDLYRAALEHTQESGERVAVCRDLARVLEWDGRGADAAEVYLQAAPLCSGIEKSALESTAGMLLIYAGRFAQGAELLRESLRDLDLPAPASGLAALAALVVGRLRLSGLESRLAKAPRRESSEAGRARVEVLHAAAFGFIFTEPLLGECLQAAHLRAALDEGTAQQLARALALEASQRSHRSPRAEKVAEALFSHAEQLAGSAEDSAQLEFVRACRGVSQFLCGSWRRAHELLGSAYRDVPRHTTGWHTTAWIYDVMALCNQGRFDQVAQRLPGLVEAAEARGDRFTETALRVSGSVPLLLASGDPGAARGELHAGMSIWEQPRFLVQHWRAMWWSAEIELYEGRAGAARAGCLCDAARLKRSFLLRVPYIRAMTAFLRARCALGTFTEDRTQRAQELRALTQQLASEGRGWTMALAAMIGAGSALCAGDEELGVRELQRAADLADRADMPAHARACQLVLADRLQGPSGRDLRLRAEAALLQNGVREPRRFAASLLPV